MIGSRVATAPHGHDFTPIETATDVVIEHAAPVKRCIVAEGEGGEVRRFKSVNALVPVLHMSNKTVVRALATGAVVRLRKNGGRWRFHWEETVHHAPKISAALSVHSQMRRFVDAAMASAKAAALSESCAENISGSERR